MDTSPGQILDYAPSGGSKYREVPEPSGRMPRGIPYIVVNEFAERFSFYGMTAILIVFMTQYLKNSAGQLAVMSADDADIWFHNFTSFVYFTPIIGALIADIFWGKYNTIIWVSLLYCAGHGVLAMGETRTHLFIGLTLIGMGAGGIKPCVSAHVGDQFSQTNEHLLGKVYNWFYFSINLGAFLAQMLIPFLRATYGPRVAFAVPGILMAVALFIFWLGRYKFVHRPALGWDRVMENFRGENLRILLRLIAFFVLVAPFYALYYQASGAWVNQAKHLDLTLHPFGMTLLQDQVQSINAILILVFIPLFTYGVYPVVERIVKLTPQRKIGAGMFIVIPAFIITAHLEKAIAAGQTPSVWWQLLGYAIVTAAEILVSIPALEFAYTQAPRKMKSMIMAAYLAGSISLGNVIASLVINFFKLDWVAPHVTGKNSPNYYWAFVGLITVAGTIYAFASWLMPARNFVAEDIPSVAAA
ncbi:MAG TPA: MFS transporter [Tepidisphaeraceae bacterium]|jgi:POT family proton-dependent oligopeptide transporter